MKIAGLIHKIDMCHLSIALALFVMLGVGSSPAFAEVDGKNSCKLYTSYAIDGNIIRKVLGKCVDGLYQGQIVYGDEYEDISNVRAGTMVNGYFKGVFIQIIYKNGTPFKFSVTEGKSASKVFGVEYENLKKALNEIYRATDMGGDNHDPANRELLLNVANKHIKHQYGFYNEFIASTGSTGIAINTPFTPTPTPAAELPDDPQAFGASASPRAAKAKGKKKK